MLTSCIHLNPDMKCTRAAYTVNARGHKNRDVRAVYRLFRRGKMTNNFMYSFNNAFIDCF